MDARIQETYTSNSSYNHQALSISSLIYLLYRDPSPDFESVARGYTTRGVVASQIFNIVQEMSPYR